MVGRKAQLTVALVLGVSALGSVHAPAAGVSIDLPSCRVRNITHDRELWRVRGQ